MRDRLGQGLHRPVVPVQKGGRHDVDQDRLVVACHEREDGARHLEVPLFVGQARVDAVG